LSTLNKTNLILSLLILEIAKSSMLGGSSFDIAASIVLGSLYGYSLYLDNNKRDSISKEISDKISELDKKNTESLKLLEDKIGTLALGTISNKENNSKFGW